MESIRVRYKAFKLLNVKNYEFFLRLIVFYSVFTLNLTYTDVNSFKLGELLYKINPNL